GLPVGRRIPWGWFSFGTIRTFSGQQRAWEPGWRGDRNRAGRASGPRRMGGSKLMSWILSDLRVLGPRGRCSAFTALVTLCASAAASAADTPSSPDSAATSAAAPAAGTTSAAQGNAAGAAPAREFLRDERKLLGWIDTHSPELSAARARLA